MRGFFAILLAAVLAAGAWSVPARAGDMREMAANAREKEQILHEKAAREKELADQEARRLRQAVLSDREALLAAVAELETENRALTAEISALEAEKARLSQRAAELALALENADEGARDIAAAARSAARRLSALVAESPFTALSPDRGEFLSRLGTDGAFPAVGDLSAMADLLAKEIEQSGQVRVASLPVVDRSGRETPADVLFIGPFTAAFRTPDETGFLLYSGASSRLFALSAPPPRGMAKKIRAYMDGEAEAAPVDVSGGSALRQMARRPGLVEEVQKGGPLVWPILAVGLLGLFIVVERIISLSRSRTNADALMDRLSGPCREGAWDQCRAILSPAGDRPVPRVLAVGLDFAGAGRQEMENALQEAILREIPRMERFLSTLGMLAAIAPLLGLLGTVTGMINTFQAITFFGTGDPRLMSGGISEALVTTMLGLSVAVPLLIFHTVLSRRAEAGIGQMEEKAVALVNAVSSRSPAP
ncbi:MAG: MotA/TolQ/ExbB proton channel family protein [Pseudomonadota bacterium]